MDVDLNPLGAENETGRAERPTSWEARSQDVELCYSPISIWADLTMLRLIRSCHLTSPSPLGLCNLCHGSPVRSIQRFNVANAKSSAIFEASCLPRRRLTKAGRAVLSRRSPSGDGSPAAAGRRRNDVTILTAYVLKARLTLLSRCNALTFQRITRAKPKCF